MIDDDFAPDRLQLRALGHLLIAAQNHPALPSLRESKLYEQVFMGQYLQEERASWLAELASVGLIKIISDGMRAGDRIGWSPATVYLTPVGAHYTISRAHIFGENARTPTDDFPNEIVDVPFILQSYYSIGSDLPQEFAPAADREVRFSDNQPALERAIAKIEAVAEALAADNEIGSQSPELRDEKLIELRLIREALDQATGMRSKMMVMAFGALGYLMAAFADRPVGALADEAWSALQALMGI